MDLMLWRHAEARDALPGESDLERPLTALGERQAMLMADWLCRHLAADATVLVSPARRCQQTAQALGRPFVTASPLAPGGSVAALLSAADWPDGRGTVLVVGHQPTLGQAAASLLTGATSHWRIKKAMLWWLRGPPPGGAAAVTLLAVQGPQTL